jgi:hypothetical protein
MLPIKTIFRGAVFSGASREGAGRKCRIACIFLLTFFPNHLIYESRCDLFERSRNFDVWENQSMKNATKKAAKPAKKKAAPKKKK